MKRVKGLIAMATIMMLAAAALGQPQAATQPAGQAAGRAAGAFNLRIVSDSVPDISSRENFIFSALSPWKTENERSLAQWRWMHRLRRVGTCVWEDNRPVLDPVLFFNSYGVTYCSMIAQMNCSIWEARGLPNRVIDLSGHVVSEVFHDDAWHMFDNDFCNYFLNEKGQVASAAELANSRIHGNLADLKPGEFYVFDHCPAASTPRGHIFMGPSAASLLEVARDWYPGPGKVKPRLGYTGSHAGHRYILGLRPNESYTRYWRPLGTGEQYARLFRNGKDPADDGTVLRNSRANGRWEWKPDVSDPATFFSAENAAFGPTGVTVKDAGKPAHVVLRVMAANVVTSATFRPAGTDPMKFFVSVNNGVSWQLVEAVLTGRWGLKGDLCKEVGGRLEYLLKVELGEKGRLTGITVETITQVNPRTLPALKLGTNQIVAVSDGHYESLTFNPRLTGDQGPKEVFRLVNFQGMEKPTDFQPAIVATDKAELVLRGQTPRPIRRVRMATTMHHPEPGADFLMSASFDGQKTWKELATRLFAGWPADHRYEVATEDVPPDTREALVKYSFDYPGCGIVNVLVEMNYDPAGPASAFMPYDLTYCWSEHHMLHDTTDGTTRGTWIRQEHTERVTGPYHKYEIKVAGTRPPRMNWVRISAPGAAGEQLRTGYSYAQPRGDVVARPGYRLELGNRLSAGCAYQVSRPASDAFPDVGGNLLTDGFFAVSSFWRLQNINLAGEKNEKRVGELAVWPSGDELVVTVDLGKAQTVGGARVCALQPNEKVLYPARMVVETSADGKSFAPAGEVGWEDCFFPPADSVVWEGTDSPVYDHLPAGGILDYRFPVVFEKAVQARFVRFRLSPPTDKNASIALWELEVYDRMSRVVFDEPVRLPDRPR